jgi:hypothetical protein
MNSNITTLNNSCVSPPTCFEDNRWSTKGQDSTPDVTPDVNPAVDRVDDGLKDCFDSAFCDPSRYMGKNDSARMSVSSAFCDDKVFIKSNSRSEKGCHRSLLSVFERRNLLPFNNHDSNDGARTAAPSAADQHREPRQTHCLLYYASSEYYESLLGDDCQWTKHRSNVVAPSDWSLTANYTEFGIQVSVNDSILPARSEELASVGEDSNLYGTNFIKI